jgi:hypothetical protein
MPNEIKPLESTVGGGILERNSIELGIGKRRGIEICVLPSMRQKRRRMDSKRRVSHECNVGNSLLLLASFERDADGGEDALGIG